MWQLRGTAVECRIQLFNKEIFYTDKLAGTLVRNRSASKLREAVYLIQNTVSKCLEQLHLPGLDTLEEKINNLTITKFSSALSLKGRIISYTTRLYISSKAGYISNAPCVHTENKLEIHKISQNDLG